MKANLQKKNSIFHLAQQSFVQARISSEITTCKGKGDCYKFSTT